MQHALPFTRKRNKSSTRERRGEPGLADWKQGEMLSNQGLGKTKPTMAKLRNHLQHKEPDGFCLDHLKEKPKQRLIF